jgi:hypothetical protein
LKNIKSNISRGNGRCPEKPGPNKTDQLIIMKTSDKIILFSTVAALGLFGASQLLQYSRYRAGDILTYKDVNREDFDPHTGTQPAWLILDGPMRARIVLSDSFHFDLAKRDVSSFRYRPSGDSLIIEGDKRFNSNPHLGWNDYLPLPAINIYCPVLKGIRIRNGFAVLENEQGQRGVSASLELDSAQVWVGAYNQDQDSVIQTEPYDSVKIHAFNSSIILNRQAYIKRLELQLDNRSDIIDRFSRMDTAFIMGDKNTNIQIRGSNFKKVRWGTPDHSTP